MLCAQFVVFLARTGFSFTALIVMSRDTCTCDEKRKVCKFWLKPVALAYNNGFSAKELNRIRKMIVNYWGYIREIWNEHCGQ